jgi:pantoate--beta-alanine ligase
MTIFVNPLQFAPGEDFERYPRDFERDRRLAEEAGAEVIFAPSAEEMYPEGFKTFVEVDQLSRILEGEFRPTHFRGVTTVVSKLFNCTKPHVAVFGQKDAQQAAIIKQMVRDLNFDIEILVGPIVREPDGLAMSSRNVYLSEIERVEARVLSEALHFARVRILNGERNVIALQSAMQSMIIQKPSAKIDYIAFVYPETFAPVEKLQSGDRVLIALAVRIGTTRLIDNDIVDVP